MKLLDLPPSADYGRLYFGFFDDFFHYVTADHWTSVLTDSGTAVVSDAVGGRITLTCSDGTVADNDEAYIRSTAELFKFADDKPIVAEAQIQFAEADTNAANIMFGLMDAVAANALLDNGGGPKASYSGCVFFKEDGQTLWSCENSLAGTQQTTQLTAANSLDGSAKTAGGSAFQKLRIECRPKSATKADFLFWIDDVLVAHHTDQTITSATEMHAVLGAKNGSAVNQTLVADYAFAFQKR
jgi:hypothetical protein